MNHQDRGTSIHQKCTSNTAPVIPIPVLKFQISWWNIITMQLIMVMYRFILNMIPWNIPLTMFQTQITLWINKLIMMKCTTSSNFSLGSLLLSFTCWYPYASCLTSGSSSFKMLYSLYCVVLWIYKIKWQSYKLHVTFFYVHPNPSQCKIG